MEVKYRDEESGLVGSLSMLRNSDGTLGKVTTTVVTDHPDKAMAIASRAVSGLLGRLSFEGNVPLYVVREIVRDPESGWTRFRLVMPGTPGLISALKIRQFADLRPIYALWRESRNTRSFFYRHLCLFKIVDGLLGTVMPRVRKTLKAAGKAGIEPSFHIPDDEFIKAATPEFVGRKFTTVRDDMRNEYRNAIAHFQLKSTAPVDLDNPAYRYQYERLFPVTDYMARALIVETERLLACLLPEDK
jgi:hypothetical protein